LRSDRREVLITHLSDAAPDHRLGFPDPSIWPLLAAIAVTGLFIGSIFTPWAVPIGAVPVGIALTGWFWPKAPEAKVPGPEAQPETAAAPALEARA
jgi:cytochrome c oxidase subunit I+III